MIPAKEFLIKKQPNGYISIHSDYVEAMIEFTKFHVEAAAKEIYKKHQFYCAECEHGDSDYISEDSILSAYPLTNIK